MLWWEILLNWIHICFSEKKDLFLCCYVASETILLNQTYVLLIYSLLKSFLRIYMKTWNLAFCFQCCLFVLKLVIYKRKFYYLQFLFLIYELNAVVSMHSNVFIQQHRLWKCYMQTFSRQDLLWFACCVSFLFINDFLTNFLTFYDFPLLLYAVFPVH